MKRYLIQEKGLHDNKCRSFIFIADNLKEVVEEYRMEVRSDFEYSILGVEPILCEQCDKKLRQIEVRNTRQTCNECIYRGY